MTTVYFNPAIDDEARRNELYAGELFVYGSTSGSLELVDFARELIEESFGSFEPTTAQYHLAVEDYVAILAEIKPKFIHHPKSKEVIRKILTELGCDQNKTYFDVPRMRTATSDDYLTSGIAYAFHPHRDTWYSAPTCQLNWWIPIYEIQADNSMAFHPRYWDRPVRNTSCEYNYQDWNKNSRFNAAKHVNTDTRKQPGALEQMELNPQLRIVAKPGDILVFSGAQMHSTVPNNTGRTRFSVDFRTVNVDDVAREKGAANIDSECTGTTMGDYLRVSDLSHLPRKVTLAYDNGPPQKALYPSNIAR